MEIRRFSESEAEAVSDLIRTTIKISNTRDYPADLMDALIETETPEHVLQRASWTHFYVAVDEDRIIGCGAIGPYWDKKDESSLFTIFVDPDYQGKGVGRAIVETLERDEFAIRAKRIEIPASITGLPFYQKMGYSFKDGITEVDEEHLYRLEKFRDLKDQRMLTTERLILRRWFESDAEDMFRYASDPDVGPICGWPVHRSIEESLDIIRNALNGREAYAVCLKENGRAVGAIELKLNGHTDLAEGDDECEMGFWLGKPFWGQGFMPEAIKEMLRHAFEDIGMNKVWIGYYEGNTKSKRVQEKSGFKFQWRSEDVDVPLMNETRTGYVSLMTKEDWEAGLNR